MHTATTVHIRARPEEVFALVKDLERWPELLPHYRWVKVLREEQGRQIVEMACERSGIPISWTSAYWTHPTTMELHFEHLKKWTKGMKVVWNLLPTRDGCRVEIVHDLNFRIPALSWLAEPIIGGFFIEHVAQRTLRTFKAILEKDLPPEPGS